MYLKILIIILILLIILSICKTCVLIENMDHNNNFLKNNETIHPTETNKINVAKIVGTYHLLSYKKGF